MSTPPVPPADKGIPEHDPTGIRDLLSALPDPGPMPADLVARINASIAAEQSAREASNVVPLRRRRWGWPQVGAAAAAAAVIAIGVPALLTGTGPGEVMASLSGGASSADSAAGAARSVESGANDGAAAPSPLVPGSDHRVAAGVGDVALEASGTAYTVAGLASQARSRLLSARDDAKDLPMAPAGAAKADTGAGLRACLTALGVPGTIPLRGDVATLDGAPAVIVIASSDTGPTVYAVSPECDAAHPAMLAGPLPVP